MNNEPQIIKAVKLGFNPRICFADARSWLRRFADLFPKKEVETPPHNSFDPPLRTEEQHQNLLDDFSNSGNV